MQISFQLISSELKDSSDGTHSTYKNIIEIHLEIGFTGKKLISLQHGVVQQDDLSRKGFGVLVFFSSRSLFSPNLKTAAGKKTNPLCAIYQ